MRCCNNLHLSNDRHRILEHLCAGAGYGCHGTIAGMAESLELYCRLEIELLMDSTSVWSVKLREQSGGALCPSLGIETVIDDLLTKRHRQRSRRGVYVWLHKFQGKSGCQGTISSRVSLPDRLTHRFTSHADNACLKVLIRIVHSFHRAEGIVIFTRHQLGLIAGSQTI